MRRLPVDKGCNAELHCATFSRAGWSQGISGEVPRSASSSAREWSELLLSFFTVLKMAKKLKASSNRAQNAMFVFELRLSFFELRLSFLTVAEPKLYVHRRRSPQKACRTRSLRASCSQIWTHPLQWPTGAKSSARPGTSCEDAHLTGRKTRAAALCSAESLSGTVHVLLIATGTSCRVLPRHHV